MLVALLSVGAYVGRPLFHVVSLCLHGFVIVFPAAVLSCIWVFNGLVPHRVAQTTMATSTWVTQWGGDVEELVGCWGCFQIGLNENLHFLDVILLALDFASSAGSHNICAQRAIVLQNGLHLNKFEISRL